MEAIDSAMGCAVFLADLNWEKESVGFDQDNFHRGCTGNAEKQLSVLSCRFSVVGCQLDS
jgi:hypothetical protein